VHDNDIYLNDQIVKIKGINWYGFETTLRCLDGLFSHPLSYYLDTLTENHFNALRIPVALQMVLYDTKMIPNSSVSAESQVYNQTSLQILDFLFQETLKRDILILLDIHRLKYGISTPLWYIPSDVKYSEESIMKGIETLIERYKNYPNFLGIDLFNEPHYQATYGSNDPNTDWRLFIEKSANNIFPKYPEYSFLFFVNGIDWGKNLSQYGDYPPSLIDEYSERIVISPHEYGPTITHVPSYNKSVLYNLWDRLFGYLKNNAKIGICIGEWGGRFENPKENIWLKTFGEYMIDHQFTNNFFWALNPYSKDVGGLMTTWNHFSKEKLDFLEWVQPNPSSFFIHDGEIQVM
jgi:endoglucanase